MFAPDRQFSKHPSRNLTGLTGVFMIAACSLALIGCMGSVALHNDTVDYSDDYANDTNQQLLNNLARLAHSDPPYFVQLGQITAQHTFNGTAGFANDSSSHNHYGASLSVGAQEQPTFQFVPITGTNFMAAISVPIPTKLFLTFFDQGKPADILARVMLDSVVLANPDSKGDGKFVFHLLRNDPLDPSYPDFLLFCIQLRDKQLHDSDFVETPSGKRIIYITGVKLSDVATALPAGMDLSPATTTGANDVPYLPASDSTSNIFSPTNEVFVTKARDVGLLEHYNTQYGPNYASDNFRYSFERNSDDKNLGPRPSITFSYSLDKPLPESDTDNTKDQNKWWVALKLRTFISVLSATAKEKERYAEARNENVFDPTNSVFSIDGDGFGYYRDTSADTNRVYVVQPILRLSQDSAEQLAAKFGSRAIADGSEYSSLASVDYSGTHYVLGDIMDSSGLPLVNVLRDSYQYKDGRGRPLGRQVANLLSSNKEVFALISDLYSDISIDPKNLPVQQLIQVQ